MSTRFISRLALLGWAGYVAVCPADDLAATQRMTQSHCGVCHTFGQGEPAGQGPNLFGVMGREAASQAGFTYSDNFKSAMNGKRWDVERLDAWLADTQQVAPGNAMTYFQPDADKRKKIIEYLKTLR